MWLLLLAVWLVWGTDVFILGKNHSLLVFLGRDFRNHMAFDHVVCVCASGLV